MAATDLTTLADVKEALNVSGTADDSWLQKLITRATGWIEQNTNRKLVARRYNGGSGTHPTTLVADEDYLYFDGDPGEVDRYGLGLHYLPQYPVQGNGVLTFQLGVLQGRDQSGDVWDTTSFLEGRDYLVDRTLGSIRLFGGRFTYGYRNYRVQCAAGYQGSAAPWVPAELQQLCIELVDLIYRDKENMKAETLGTFSREFDTAKTKGSIADVPGAYTRTVVVS